MKNYLDKIILKSNLTSSILLIVLFCISNVINILSIVFMFYGRFDREIKLFSVLIITQILISIAFILAIVCFATMVIYLIFRIKKFDVSLNILFSCVSFSIIPLIIINIFWGMFMAYNYTNIDVNSLSFSDFSIKLAENTVRISNIGVFKILRYFFYIISVLLLLFLVKRYKVILQERKNEITH
ncbi:MAG: hypothetical protein PT934_01460 [Peptoniphilaceae bacterium]|nr:hypothetical protein [Peptoniphilaceae bacterium]